MWRFRVVCWDPVEKIYRGWVSDAGFAEFLTAYEAAHTALENYGIALPRYSEDNQLIGIDIFLEVPCAATEETQEEKAG